ncbi:MAG: hypothetical protein KJP00_05130 [Bacteroidia bacterium]|nr:hypothetical protein [Bacteroidia bacterium]
MKKSVKYISIILGVIILGLIYFMFVYKSDLRTDQVKKDPQPIEGRALLMKMGKAHGIENWDSIATYTVAFQDEFFGRMGKNAHPFPSSQMEMILDYIPNTFNGRLSFDDGTQWGLQAWKPYLRQRGGNPVFKKDDDISFWIPTYQYFMELPLRLQSATAVAYAGERVIDGIECTGIFVSWNKYKPQSNVDQYLLWIDKKTHLIHQVEYTVRDVFRFMKARIDYKAYQDFYGLQIATDMPVHSLFGDGLMHRMKINGIQINMVPKEDLLPDQSLPYVEDAKEVLIED